MAGKLEAADLNVRSQSLNQGLVCIGRTTGMGDNVQ
jgi:hypothetical protein